MPKPMVTNFQSSCRKLLKIAIALIKFVGGRDIYVVQTSDNMLHFVTDKLESHSLDFIISPVDGPAPVDQGQCAGVQKYAGGMHSERVGIEAGLMLKTGKDAGEYSSGAPERRGTTAPETAKHEGQHVRKASRIDSLTVEKGGFVLINGKEVYIEDLLIYPVIENGIYLSAAQDHIPRLINNTVVIVANVKVYILDLYDYSSKTIKFSQIMHLYDTFRSLDIVGNSVLLNGRLWGFDSRIVAVFILKEKDGFNFMLRVMANTGIRIYRPRARKSYRMYVLATAPLILALFCRRNIKYGACISKREGMYLGTFVKKECLVYQVDSQLLHSNRNSHSLAKHSNLINMLYDGIRLFQPVIVTEKTFQLDPRSPASLADQNGVAESTPDGSSSRMKTSIQTVVKTVEFLHSKGVVHSRICPENLRVTEHGHIRVQNIFSNVGWRSIKQLRGIKSRGYETSVLDDMFSLGCVVHYYLTGYHPFDLRDFVKAQRKSSKVLLPGKKDGPPVQQDASHLDEVAGLCSQHPAVRGAHAQASVTLEDGSLGCGSVSARSEHCCRTRAMLRSLGKYLLKIPELVKSPLARKKESQPPYFKRVLGDESAANIEYNILFSTCKLRIEDQVEHDFVYHCLKAPLGQGVLSLSSHPYFWDFSKITDFICDSSDFIETNSYLKQRLERSKRVIFEGSWLDYLDPRVSVNVLNRRLYDYQSVCDLVRFIRNCQRHYQELRNREFFEKLEGRAGQYFTSTFPELLMFLYRSPMFRGQDIFEKYYC